MIIDRSRGYYHLGSKRMYRITGFPLVRMNGPHDEKWVEGVEYRPMDSAVNETPHKDMDAVFVDSMSSFKERMSVTNERVEMSDEVEDLAKAVEGSYLGKAFPTLSLDIQRVTKRLRLVKDMEAEIARLDTDGSMTAILKDLWESGHTRQNNRDLYDLASTRHQPLLNRVTMDVLDRMARRLRWTRTEESLVDLEYALRHYTLIVTRNPEAMAKFATLVDIAFPPQAAA